MKYYRYNQIAMAVLGALLLFFGTRTLINIAFEEHEPEKPGYEVAGTEKKEGEDGKGAAGGEEAALIAALATADAARGGDVSKKCAVCHGFDKGGPNMIGPNLYGVLGRDIASHEGYEYSAALQAKEGNWDYLSIDEMVHSPNIFAPGTKMALFPGLPDIKQRADLLMFIRTKTDNPPPLPEAPAAAAAPEGGAPAGKEAGKGEAAAGSPILALIATADAKQGQADAALCKVCHSFEKGGATLVGPNLYGVIGHTIAGHEGFNYTPALKAHEGVWSYENLDPWLKNPQAFAPGTMMAFPGVADDKKRANIIAYLRENSDSPAPLPEAGGEKSAAPAANTPAPAPAAEGEAAPAAETPAAPAPAPDASPSPPKDLTPEPAAPAFPPAPPAAESTPPAEATPPAAESAPPAEATPPAADTTKSLSEEPAASDGAAPSMGEPPSPSQPQPVYPGGL
ncbi:MAG: c-type cytochrome [Methyloceanibacter sp.]|uniref:c-type cytochrome n=1 Tax=Methyloceanibacter sp. TaxID=1965321 RepID=UPI003D9B6AA1